MDFFDAHSIFFTVFGYKLSYLEFFAVITGIVSVVLSAKASVWSWPVGIINVFLSAFLYYQSQLYPDMFLMVFFFVTNIMGWWRWTNPKPEEEDRNKELKISFMPLRQFTYLLAVGIFGTLLIGTLAGQLHNWLPLLFNLPSAYPFVDSFIFVMSIITTFLMIQKRVECWIIWLIIDIVATYLYFLKGIKFMGIEYFIFTIIAGFALWNWIKEYKGYSKRISNTEDL